MEEKLKVVEFFGGIGAVRKALERLGVPFEVVDYVEIDENAVKSYNAMYETNFEPQDICEWNKDIEVNLIMHGSPCFVKGTKIKTDTSYKNIEDIVEGDKVLTHTNTYQKVLKTGYNENKQIWELKTNDSDNATFVTGNHPFYIFNSSGQYEWKEIQYINKKDKLCKINNNEIKHLAITSLKPINEFTTVYNLEVENDNSYTANDYIVHNCQDFSRAGKQKGGDEGSGTRSSLMYETIRNIEKLGPEYVIWENVKGLLDEDNLPNFQKYLNIMDELGYNNYYQVLNAKDYGIPQNRERVFTVSIRKDIDGKQFSFPKKKLLNISLKDILEKEVDEKYYLTTPKLISISKWNAYQKPLENVLGQNSVAPTLTARGAGEEHSGMITYSEDLDETTNIQQELEKYVLNDQIEYKDKIVNLPAVCASRGRKTDNEDDETKLQQIIEVNTNGLSNTLTTVEKDNYVIEKNKKQLLCEHLIDNDMVESYDVINHGYTEKRFETLENGKDIVTSKNIAPTITTRPDELGVTVESNSNLIDVGDIGLRIRKLTPKECWRLMGFDDEDFEKASKVNGSSELYKQAGNSIVVDVLMAILENLFKPTRTDHKHFKFPDKQVLYKTYEDLLETEYDPNLVVLNEDDLKMVKDFGATYSFGGYVVKDNLYPTITASYGKTSGNSGKIPCREGFRILTPKEAWRFMGFDDEDYEKANKVNGPVALYSQAGNSIVVPVLEAILKNLLHTGISQDDYRLYRNNIIIDHIARALLTPKIIDENGNANIEFWAYGYGCSFYLTIEKYSKFKDILCAEKFSKGIVSQFIIKLIEVAIIKARELDFMAKYRTKLDIDINEIISFITSSKADTNNKSYIKGDISEQIRNTVLILNQVKIRFDRVLGTNKWVKICTSNTALKKGKLHFAFSEELFQILRDYGTDTYIMLDLLRFNEKYDQNYYLVFKKILSNIGTASETTISVKELYRYCSTLPRVEDVARTNRAYTQRIRRPLEDVLNKLDTYFDWEYEDTDDMTFSEWLEKATIKIKLKDEIKNITKVA